MANKSLKRLHMINYFIDAAVSIIREDGISGITIRKVADKTGYNSATLYNYFKNLDHLICLAAVKLMGPYAASLSEGLQSVSSALEKNLKVWELFCIHSFQNPEIYEAIFFARFDGSQGSYGSRYPAEYYDLFPDNAPRGDSTLSDMLSSRNIYERTHILLEECVKEGFFYEGDLEAIDEMSIFLYKGMLSKALAHKGDFSPEKFTHTAMNYIKRCYKSFLRPEKLGEAGLLEPIL